MRLVDLVPRNNGGFTAIFERDGKRVEKFVKGLGRDSLEVRLQLVRKAREAARDIAYQEYGEKWKEHVEWGGFFDAPTDEEKQMIEEALLG